MLFRSKAEQIPTDAKPVSNAPVNGGTETVLLVEDELAGVLEELTRMGQYLDELVARTTTCYEYAVSWAAKRAAGEVWRLRERLTYDRDQLLYAVYGLRDLLKDGPVRVRDIRRWARNADISEGLLALAGNVVGATSGPNEHGHIVWTLPE